MVAYTRRALMAVLALFICVGAASAQQDSRPPAFTQQEIDQMLAPIALYPDSLLSQILMAATYPRDIGEAAQWSRSNADLNGDRAVREVERYDWDPSVKSLVAFPQILDMMDAKRDWTQDLGDAFLDQQAQVMDTVQYLRRQAYAAGNLRSSDQLRVDVRDSSFVIDYVNPALVYVPYYDPVVVYGRWWWPTHRPVYWSPWPGYYARPGYAGYMWGPPISVSRGFFYGAPDWQHRRINVVNVNNYYYRAPAVRRDAPQNVAAGVPRVWEHDSAHRGEVQRDRVRREAGPHLEAAPERRQMQRQEAVSMREHSPASVQPPAQARVAPAPAVVPAPVVAPPPAARVEPARSAEMHRYYEQRGTDGRAERRDNRFEPANRSADRTMIQPAAPALAPAHVAAPAQIAQPQPPVMNQARVAPLPMPVPTAPPGAGNRVYQQPAVAAAQRAPDSNRREAHGNRETANRSAPADNTVAASPQGNANPAAQNGNGRGNWRHGG